MSRAAIEPRILRVDPCCLLRSIGLARAPRTLNGRHKLNPPDMRKEQEEGEHYENTLQIRYAAQGRTVMPRVRAPPRRQRRRWRAGGDSRLSGPPPHVGGWRRRRRQRRRRKWRRRRARRGLWGGWVVRGGRRAMVPVRLRGVDRGQRKGPFRSSLPGLAWTGLQRHNEESERHG